MDNMSVASFAVLLTICCTYARILRLSCKDYANFSYVANDAVLQGSVLETFKNISTEQCEENCIEEHFCKSINVENGGERTCELNSDTPSDATDYVTLTNKTGWTFKSTNFSDPTIGEICKDLNPCIDGELCLDTCECPGYECHRCRGLSEGKTCITDAVDGRPVMPLGMQSKEIKNYQISSSSENFDAKRLAVYGRLNYPGTWCSNAYDMSQYFRVDFTKRTVITAVAIQAHPTKNIFITHYWLVYTTDSYLWQVYQENGSFKLLLGPANANGIANSTLQQHIRVFGIFIVPNTWNAGICMRMELYGIEDPEQPAIPKGCKNNVRPLGMASKAIPDANITASSTYDKSVAASKARLNAYTAWCAAQKRNMKNEYIQVDFGKVISLHAIAVQGRHYHGDYVTRYKVLYSNSTIASFETVMNGNVSRIFQGSFDRPRIVKQKLNPPVDARFVRINPQEYVGDNLCMRMELYGCDKL